MPLFDELGIGPWKVDLDIAPNLPSVVADPSLLRRALSNVLVNALRFTPSDKRVRIAASTFNGVVEIRIVDQGPGVPDDRKEDIFVPFHRLGDTDNTTDLGLGMALSKGFVESMGGTIEPEDTPGGGLTMVISLRVADPSLYPGQPIPREERPDPSQMLGENTLNLSGAISDVILPLPGEGPSEERGLDRFINYGITRSSDGTEDDTSNGKTPDAALTPTPTATTTTERAGTNEKDEKDEHNEDSDRG